MSAAADARGLKRVCVECGIRFYDMSKRPIICPNCDTEFTGVEKVKSRRSRAATPTDAGTEGQVPEKKAKATANDDDTDDEDEEDDDGVEIVSLDDDSIAKVDDSSDDDVGAVSLDADSDDDDDDIDLDDDDLGNLESLEDLKEDEGNDDDTEEEDV